MNLLTRPSLNDRKDSGRSFLFFLLSFILPFIILLLSAIALHITPFGEHNFGLSDGQGYIYGLPGHGKFIKSALQGQANWLYSLGGLGNNTWSSLSWGGLAPAKMLAVFCTMESAPDCLTWITLVNLSLCGLTMYILLCYKRGHVLSNLIFSTSYALIGFNVVNCYQMLFFIGPQMLPLMILGLIKLLEGKSPLTYILSLAICIFFNFYFGFHLCVASLVFFLAFFYAESESIAGRKDKLIGTWFGSSVIAGLLPAFFWFPALKAFSGGGRLNQTGAAEFELQENMPFIQIFSKLFSGANSTSEMVDGLPNIFCGILVVALVVLFFMNKKIPVKKKRAAAVMIGFYLLTFYITAFTLLMHGGTHTNWFPYRYSYVFSFLLIYIAAYEFEYLDEITLADTKRAAVGLLIAAILVFSVRYSFISGGSVLLDFALLFVMWLGFWVYKTKPEKAPKRVFTLLLLLLVCGNLYANFVLSIYKVQKKEGWELDLEEYRSNVFTNGALIDGIKAADTGFYRMEKDKSDLGSVGADSGLYGYYGVSGSGPAIRENVHRELCKIGVNWFDMRHWYSEGIPAATDTLLGLKYLVSERDLTEEKGYEKRAGIKDTSVYQNHYPLLLSILSDAPVADLTLGDDVFQNLNSVWKAMTGGSKDIFTEQDDVTFSLHSNTTDQTITSSELRESVSNAAAGIESAYQGSSYFEYTFEAAQDGAVYVFDTSIPGSPNGLSEPAIKYVGYYRKGDPVTGTVEIAGSGTGDFLRGYCANLVFAYANNDVLKEYAEKLNARDISFDKDLNSHLFGTFTADKNQRILFTIPWDEGWACCIDGQKVPIDKTWDLFMSVAVPEGQHTWEMKFFPAWMDYGLMISGATLISLLVFMVMWKKKKPVEEVDLQTPAENPEEIKVPDTEGSV